jgi:hypothetical protein
MPAFMVFIREKTLDQSELEAYWAKVRATLEGRPVKVLAAYACGSLVFGVFSGKGEVGRTEG